MEQSKLNKLLMMANKLNIENTYVVPQRKMKKPKQLKIRADYLTTLLSILFNKTSDKIFFLSMMYSLSPI